MIISGIFIIEKNKERIITIRSPVLRLMKLNDGNFLTSSSDNIMRVYSPMGIIKYIMRSHKLPIKRILQMKNDKIISRDKESIKIWSNGILINSLNISIKGTMYEISQNRLIFLATNMISILSLEGNISGIHKTSGNYSLEQLSNSKLIMLCNDEIKYYDIPYFPVMKLYDIEFLFS